MPNEIELKIAIRQAVIDAHDTHGGQAASDRLYIINPTDASTIANAVYDTLIKSGAIVVRTA
jgi:hypothetical protein